MRKVESQTKVIGNYTGSLMKFGEFELNSLSDGIMRLDGGAMFGVVPRIFWEKANIPDGKNRIAIGVNPLLIKANGCNILVDTGNGDKFSEKLLKIDSSGFCVGKKFPPFQGEG